MKEIEEFVDGRHNGWCIHCAGALSELKINRDHVPSKSLLEHPYPPNLPIIPVCATCNSSFSSDEEYFIAFLSCAISGSSEPSIVPNLTAKRILERSPALKKRIEQSRSDFVADDGAISCVWLPEMSRVNNVILKNARGHVFFEYGEPMLNEPSYVRSAPLGLLTADQRADFEKIDNGGLYPEVGSRMLTRILTGAGMQDGWVIVQDGIYRYSIVQSDALIIRTVLFEYLATEVCWED